MATKRRVNWISQQRVDVPDMRALESAVSNDFDELIQGFVTGTQQGYILRGFEIAMAGAIGGAASGLQLLVDPGSVFHIASSVSGTSYLVPSGTPPQQLNSATNNIVDGAFAPSAINYVGLEYERYIDDTTSSQVYLWNPTTNNETTKNAPRASVLRFRIKITTSTFAANVLPIATVTTDAGNNVVSITDARYSLFRLGTGGANPNPFYQYPWTAQSEGRTENPSSSANNAVNPFHGGDKMLGSLKDWMNAVMSNIQEIKGTTYWYSQSSSGSLESLRQDLGNTVITGRGQISHSETTAGLMNWDEDINIRVIGSRLAYSLLANPASTDITLGEEEVAYITLVRGIAIVPNLIYTNGSPIVTSVGAVAWTGPLQAGDWIKIGSEDDSAYYQILTVDSLTQVTLVENFAEASTGAGGQKSKYSYGSYSSNPAPSTDRHIYVADRKDVPQGENVFWLFLRSDNSGSTPRVYVRFLGQEIEQGESEDISDTTSKELLKYIGSPSESSYKPQYVAAVDPGSVPEITDILFGSAATISSDQYFLMYSSGSSRSYYVWANKDGTGVDPTPPGVALGIEVVITTGMTAPQVAAAYAAAIGNTANDDFVAVQKAIPNTDMIRVTNTSAGVTADTVNFDMGAPFAITKIQDGTGSGNYIVQDGDNLTLAIKKLDEQIGSLNAALDDPSYEEEIGIVAAGGVPPDTVDGPVTAGSILALPDNSRLAGAQQNYTVGKGTLVIFLNGQKLILGTDYNEVGVANAISNDIEVLQQLEIGDILQFRMQGLGSGAAGAGGGPGPQGPPGAAGPAGSAGADAVGGPVAISTKIADYTVQNSDNVLKANCAPSNADIIFQLPTAASAIGQVFYFKKIDATANAMIIQAFGSELIDGLNTQSTTVQWEGFMLISDGTTWSLH
jgi:hypothetical protein